MLKTKVAENIKTHLIFEKFLPSLVEGSRAAWFGGGASGDEGRNYIRGESTIGYTGCFTTLGHNCRRSFPRSL
jgi:hypothetical protein